MSVSFLTENLRLHRKVHGLTQHDISATAGTTTSRISQIEKGIVPVSATILTAYARALNCSYEFLFAKDPLLQEFIKYVEQRTLDRNYDTDVQNACFELIDRNSVSSDEIDLVYNILGKLFLNQGAYKKAYHYFLLINGNGNYLNEISWKYINHINLALTCYHLRRYDRATMYLNEIEQFYHFTGNIEDKYRVVHLRGSICIHQGEFAIAEGLFQDLLKFAKDTGKQYEEYSAIHNLGYNYMKQKKYQKAAFQMALASSKAFAANDSFKISEIASDLSLCYIDMGEFTKAEKIIVAALDHAKDNYVEAKLQLNLARCREDPKGKLELLNRVCSKVEKMNYPGLLKDVYKQLGIAHSQFNDFERSSLFYEKALIVSETLSN